jgi:hypothetical protein
MPSKKKSGAKAPANAPELEYTSTVTSNGGATVTTTKVDVPYVDEPEPAAPKSDEERELNEKRTRELVGDPE